MKKTVFSIATGAVNAATLVAGQNYTINILADGVSCFTFGDCSTAAPGSISYFTDNGSGSNYTPVSSAVAGDGRAGFMNISTAADGAGGVNFTVNSFNMDTYLGTAGGEFHTRAVDTSGMSGSIDASGNISLDLAGRTGLATFFAGSLGEQPWNTGATFTSGNQTNPFGTLTGAALALDGTARIVSADLVGPAWGFFVGTPYTEVFSIQIVVVDDFAVPVPAAAWLFASGLLGMFGVARKQVA
ncbi:MAG: hypothetical protein WCZ87_06135 [Thiohalobacteraceae bacterium]